MLRSNPPEASDLIHGNAGIRMTANKLSASGKIIAEPSEAKVSTTSPTGSHLAGQSRHDASGSTSEMTQRIRLLIATGSMGGGGSERQIIGILRNLDRNRFRPVLYLTYPQGELLEEVPDDVPVLSFWESHRQPRIYVPGRIHRAQVRDFERVLREQQIDAVYDRTFMMTLVAGPATRRCGVPRISVVVADPSQDVAQNAGRFVRIKRNRLKKAYLDADRVATVSEGVRQATIDYYGLPREKVITLRNSIDIERIKRLCAEARPSFDSDRFHIVAAGRLTPQKGFLYLLEAIEIARRRSLPMPIQLHLLGAGPQHHELESFIQARELENDVRLYGFVANPHAVMAAADLFCLSSLYEGMPNALLEAIACQVPVLSTDCPSGPREILRDGKFGKLVPPGDAKALADAIEHAIGNPIEWKARVEPAYQHILRDYSPSAGISRLESTILSVVESQNA